MQAGANGSVEEAEDSRWMTYAELANARRIATSSATRLVLRRGWRRQRDNHGIMRALVPPEWAEPATARTMEADPHVGQAISVLEVSVAVLRERAEVAEQAARSERDRADRAIEARDAERSRANFLRDRIDALRADLAEAMAVVEMARHEVWEAAQAAEELRQADAAWRALGRIERVRRAWRGE